MLKQLQIQPVDKDIDTNRLERALELDGIMNGRLFQFIKALKEFSDKELYIELGYPDLKSYCKKRFEYSYTSAVFYLQISEKFGGYLDSVDASTESINSSIESSLSTLPLYKLYQLSRLPEAQIEQLMTTGEVTVNRKKLSFERIKETSREDLAKIISNGLDAPKSRAEKEEMKLVERKAAIYKGFKKLAKLITPEGLGQEVYRQFIPIAKATNAWLEKNIEK